jgi:carboxyl-terminal processing protease
MALFRRNSLGPLTVAMSLAALLGFGVARGLHATDDMRSHLDLFSQVLYLVQNNYVEVPDNEKLIKGAIDGMLKTLDPHTVHLPVVRAQRMDEEFQGEYSGVGVQFELRDGAIVVIAALEGGPSYRLGIQAGDRIVEIDSKALAKTLTNDDVFKMLRGPAGTTVAVTIERDGETEPLHFSIERAKIPLESVPYAYMIQPGVGYVRINRFAQTTGAELEKALSSLRQQGMKSLMLDLRGNYGGLLSQAVEVLDQLIPQNKRVVYTRGRINSANADYYTSERTKLADGPIVVLIDHGTASASEIVAGAIQDLDRGLVAGVNSFGKGLVQNQLRLGDGSKLLLTIAKYYTPSGRLIQRPYDKFTDRNDYAEDASKEDVPSDSELASRPKFKTLGGRNVYGGGGIYPDVVLKEGPVLTRPQIDMLQKRVFFEFATHYVATHKDHKWTPEMLGRSFVLADEDWNKLHQVIVNRKAAVNDSVWQADRPFMLQQVRSEVAAATLGRVERYKILVEDDPQMLAALNLFPQASSLMSRVMDDGKPHAKPSRDGNAETSGGPPQTATPSGKKPDKR